MKFGLLSAILLMASACGTGGDDACQRASNKVLSCMRSLDCAQFTDTSDRADCEAQKAAAMGESGSMAGQACTGDLKTRADEINKCTLDQARLCGACTADTADPSTAAPSNGAKLFDWNACYSNNANSMYNVGETCFHQWGSYPASCVYLASVQYARGKKCKNVCNTGDCTKGCYDKYSSSLSYDYLASAYTCNW